MDTDKIKYKHSYNVYRSVSSSATHFFIMLYWLAAIFPYSYYWQKEKERTTAWWQRSFPFKIALKGRPNNKMIRFFTELCKTILENITDYDLFLAATGSFSHYGAKCPGCGVTGKLSPYGSYKRNLVSRAGEEIADNCVSPCRYKCKICGTTHAMLPDII